MHRNLAPGWANDPDVREYFAESQIGTRLADAPILYLQGTVDLLHMVSRKQVHRMCAVGDVVTYTEYPGLEHDPIVWKGWAETKNWLADRFAGTPAPNDC